MKITFYFKAEFCSQPSEKIQNLKIRQIEADQKSPLSKPLTSQKLYKSPGKIEINSLNA